MKISISSSRKRGLTPDLRLVQKYLKNNIEDLEISYFMADETSKNRMAKKGFKDAKKRYCNTVENVICVDASIQGKKYKTGKKVLIAVPYDYQFKAVNRVETEPDYKKTNSFKGFDYIIAGSPFTKEVYTKCYNIPNCQIIENVVTPMAWNMRREKAARDSREKYERMFPKMKGKKVIAILTNGKVKEDEPSPYEGFHLKKVLDSIDSSYFVITNSEEILDHAITLGNEYTEKFAYINKALDPRRILYFAEYLFTNSGMYASYMAGRGKSVYCIGYVENNFEKFMKRRFPNLYIKTLNSVPDYIQEYGEENKNFSRYFSYEKSENPCEVIKRIYVDSV
ncbi:MAG: hypothetical protein HFG29_09140 [Eubacterium sp.]|nr:hypothetical protein [Eubacterium sp.]